jgi:hypothetical protein
VARRATSSNPLATVHRQQHGDCGRCRTDFAWNAWPPVMTASAMNAPAMAAYGPRTFRPYALNKEFSGPAGETRKEEQELREMVLRAFS